MTPSFSFSFTPETNLFSVLVNNQNLVEFNLNILSNNLNTKLCLNEQNDNKNHESNLNEFIYLIIDHLAVQKPNLRNFSHYIRTSLDFRSTLNFFLYDQIIFHFEKKLKNALSFGSMEFNNSLRKYWLELIYPIGSSSNKTEIDNSIHLAKMYHQLIHSDFMNLIIKYEYKKSLEYSQKYNQYLRSSNNELWSTQIESLKHKQQRQFSKFLFNLYDDYSNAKLPNENLSYYIEESDFDDFETINPNNSTKIKNSDESMPKRSSRVFKDTSFNRNEESYTIQLGAQLKSTHNLRLVRCDILEYCRNRFKTNSEENMESLTDFIEPHSMLTAMSLYSANKLNALVLLINNILDNKSSLDWKKNNLECNDLSQAFRELCHKNGYDFHFQSIDEQIETAIKCINSVRKIEGQKFAQLNTGDFYVTKHSNLSQTHVVFHLATFDNESETNSLKKSDLSSRHPVILGLRNILKSCIQNNVQTITIPLLLTHQMTEVI